MIAHESLFANAPLDGLSCAARELADNAAAFAAAEAYWLGQFAGGGSLLHRAALESDDSVFAWVLDWYKAQGCFTEIIRYKTRLFVPIDGAAIVIARLASSA